MERGGNLDVAYDLLKQELLQLGLLKVLVPVGLHQLKHNLLDAIQRLLLETLNGLTTNLRVYLLQRLVIR